MKQGWESKKLMEVCEEITDGSHFSPKSSGEEEYPYITVRDIDNDIIDFDNCKFINKNDYHSLLKNGCKPNYGDLLFSKDGTVGKVSLVDFDKDFVVLSSLAIIRPKRKIIESALLKYILKDPSFLRAAIGMKTGVAIRRIILKNLKQIEISFPKSLTEQQSIVSILDEAFAAIAKAKANAEQNLKNAKELFENYLQGVFENKGEGWEEKTLGEACILISKGSSPKWQGIKYVDEPGVLFVTSENVGENTLLLEHRKYVEEKFNISDKKSILKNGDVLTNIVGASIGRTAIFDLDDIANINQAVCLIRCNEELLFNEFLMYLLNSPFTKQHLHDNEVDNARANLSLGFFRSMSIPLPKLSEQINIVGKIKAFHTETQKLEVIYQQKINDLEELKKSILQKAFSGELKTAKALV